VLRSCQIKLLTHSQFVKLHSSMLGASFDAAAGDTLPRTTFTDELRRIMSNTPNPVRRVELPTAVYSVYVRDLFQLMYRWDPVDGRVGDKGDMKYAVGMWETANALGFNTIAAAYERLIKEYSSVSGMTDNPKVIDIAAAAIQVYQKIQDHTGILRVLNDMCFVVDQSKMKSDPKVDDLITQIPFAVQQALVKVALVTQSEWLKLHSLMDSKTMCPHAHHRDCVMTRCIGYMSERTQEYFKDILNPVANATTMDHSDHESDDDTDGY
jgi:hypothetical protein